MHTPDPKPAGISPVAMSDLMAAQQKMHASMLEVERVKAQSRLKVAVTEAKLHTTQVMRHAAAETYARGAYPIARLENDPYRDTRATLAEVRTNSFALKLVLDAVEYTYDVDGYVQGRYTQRRISRHFDDLAEAREFFARACDRFFRISDFRTLVDF